MENRSFSPDGPDRRRGRAGRWQLGADWGEVSEEDALAVLHAAVDAGVTFLDTADVYGDGRSEQLIGRFLRERPTPAADRRHQDGPARGPQVAARTTRRENFRAWTDRSRRNLGVDTLDLVQLHCPPTAGLLRRPGLRRARHAGRRGRIAAYGVSASRPSTRR